MSVVAIPFKDEPAEVILTNVEVAARHARIDEVWAVGDGARIAERARRIGLECGKKIEVFPEERLGTLRPGKGDAMNTALQRAAVEDIGRLHFYDADITNFDSSWIDGAEGGADAGFDVVRHTFPRAATDAMVTWFITKPLLAAKYPGTLLPRIGQPLGGEILLTRAALRALSPSKPIRERSDWGIDTLLTHGTVDAGLSLYEHHVAAGKQHALYGSLQELRQMVLECFDAARSLPDRRPATIEHHRDDDAPVPEELKRQIGYSREQTLPLLVMPLESAESAAAATAGGGLPEMLARVAEEGDVQDVDANWWGEFLRQAVKAFSLGDEGWESLLFRMWVARVVHYTERQASQSFEFAMGYLEGTIKGYEVLAT
ncbi:MAG: hypothetical protein DWQ40_04275 [Actinobacteria bacterium]|nr:MAG: hypothetical protein DWQ40_04275 [Actinomycetota bacterium]REK39805.1 MAG: hypothetical protein DWQ20_02755 [Actinomycetota bacterium]